jgi:hypothetical protein
MSITVSQFSGPKMDFATAVPFGVLFLPNDHLCSTFHYTTEIHFYKIKHRATMSKCFIKIQNIQILLISELADSICKYNNKFI